MTDGQKSEVSAWPARLARLAALFGIAIGGVVLMGWTINSTALKSIVSHWPHMRANSAFCLVLAGISLLICSFYPFKSNHKYSRVLRWGLVMGAITVSMIGMITLCQYFSGIDLGIDQLLFTPNGESNDPRLPGRMAPATALYFSLLGPTLILTQTRRHFALFQFMSWLGFLIGWLGCSPYFYNGSPLLPFAQVAFHTAIGFTVLSTGVLATRLDGGLGPLLISDTAGGQIARRLVPAALFVPILLAWLRLRGQNAGWFTEEEGRSLLALANVVTFGGLTWISARRLRLSDLKQRDAEVLLRDSQRRLESTLETGKVGTFAYNIRSDTSWNDEALEKVLGRTTADLEGGSSEIFFTFVHPDDVVEARTAFQSSILTGSDMNSTFRYVRPDNQIIWITTRGRVEKDSEGRPLRLVGTCIDTTERMVTADQIKEQASLFDISYDGLFVWEFGGEISSWNRAAEDLYGFSRNEAIGRTPHQLLQTETISQPDGFHETLRQNGRWEGELRHTARDGHKIFVESRMVLFHKPGHTYVLEAVRDIGERKSATKKLETQLSRLELLNRITRAIGERQDLRSIFQAVIRRLEDDLPLDFCCVCLYDAVDRQLTITNVGAKSPQLAQTLGMNADWSLKFDTHGLDKCLQGRLVYEPDIGSARKPFPQKLASAGLRSLVAAPLLVESQVFGVLVAARQDPDSFSKEDCEFLRQLSEHVALASHQTQTHGALQQAYEDLRQTQQTVVEQERLRALGQMASGIAHDINNALSPVALYTDLLLSSNSTLSAKDRSYLEIIDRAVEDVGKTVARMREFYRQREPAANLLPLNMNSMVQQVVDLTRARWSDMPQSRGIYVDMKLELDSNLPRIAGIENEIREALTNLVFNAVDALPEGGTITIRTSKVNLPAGHGVVLEVSDTGIGMDEATRMRCLEPFFTTKGERGTGLGLGMVYGIVQRHGGEMDLASTPGIGTTFKLIFPESTDELFGAEASNEVHTNSLRILLVDDDPLILQSMRDILEADGHAIVSANSGQAGIDTFLNNREQRKLFDVVITDLGMPHVDGRQVATALKSSAPDVPIIMLTGWGQRLVAEGDVPVHVDQMLSKPPKLRDLREALKKVTDESRKPSD